MLRGQKWELDSMLLFTLSHPPHLRRILLRRKHLKQRCGSSRMASVFMRCEMGQKERPFDNRSISAPLRATPERLINSDDSSGVPVVLVEGEFL